MIGSADWAPVVFATCVPLLCAGVVLALHVAVRQGRLDQEVREIKGDVRDLTDDVRYLTRRTTGTSTPSERREGVRSLHAPPPGE